MDFLDSMSDFYFQTLFILQKLFSINVLENNSHFGKKVVLPMKSAFYSFYFRCFRSKRNSKLMQKYAISLVTCFCFQNAFASKNMCIFNRFLVAKCVVHKKKFPTFFTNQIYFLKHVIHFGNPTATERLIPLLQSDFGQHYDL